MKTYYVAGPIAGRENGNAAAFAAAVRRLEGRGHVAVNPHTIPPYQHPGVCPPGPAAGQTADGQEAAHAAPCYMRTDMQAMLTCDAIYLLDGWENSTGAIAEFLAARAAGLAVEFERGGQAEIRGYQSEASAWVTRNFGDGSELAAVGGLAEEVGEVCRAAVKRSQGIRGTREEWDAEIRKECADVFIKLCDVARFYGFDLSDAIEERWGAVSQRDWVVDPQGHGIGGAS